MSLIDRLKKARNKADKLSEKSKQAKSKGKEGKAARLEKRSEKKTGKANKLGGKLGAKIAVASIKASKKYGLGETMQRAAKELTYGSSFGIMGDLKTSKPAGTKKSGPVDTSRKTSYKRKNK